ncbi:MAG: zinc-dependent metalloprotease [candidate division Zixibacteria bacterium]|nr:zinc-dependent metalloprotease [candidate division Zixibacteria bacterium]
MAYNSGHKRGDTTMAKLSCLLLLLLLLASVSLGGDKDQVNLKDPVGLFVDGSDDTVTTAVASLACLYLKMKGYDPINLNDAWEEERKLHEKRAIRKRASKYGIESLIYLNLKPPDKSVTHHLFKWRWRSTAALKLKEKLFQMNVDADFHLDAKSKRPDYTREFNQAVLLSTELDFKVGGDLSLRQFEPAIRLVGLAIDSILSFIPDRSDSSVAPLKFVPTTAVCDRQFKQFYGEDWTREMAKQIYMANVVLIDNLGVALNVQANMLYDVPREVESIGDLLSHLQTANLTIPDGIVIFFTGYNLDIAGKMLFTLDALGMAPLVGKRTVIASTPMELEDAKPWDHLYEGLTVAHEVGHMFGAAHTDDHNSIMYPIANVIVPEFDTLNKARIDKFLPLIMGQSCFIDSLTYDQLIDSLLVAYPDTFDMVKVLNGVMYDFDQGRKLTKNTPDLDSDYFYTIASGIQLFKYDIKGAARDKFVRALDNGPGFSDLFYLTGLLYLEADSTETGCTYLDEAREAGRYVPLFSECIEADEPSDSTSEDESEVD